MDLELANKALSTMSYLPASSYGEQHQEGSMHINKQANKSLKQRDGPYKTTRDGACVRQGKKSIEQAR